MLTTFDLIAMATILICVILSAMRGLIREILSFFGWIIALVGARFLALDAANLIFPTLSPRELAVVCGFVLVYIAVKIMLTILNNILDFTIEKIHLSFLNRALGAVLGSMKGILFVAIAVLVASFSNLPQSDAWKNAISAPFFEQLASHGVSLLPESLHQYITLNKYLDATENTAPQPKQPEILTPQPHFPKKQSSE